MIPLKIGLIVCYLTLLPSSPVFGGALTSFNAVIGKVVADFKLPVMKLTPAKLSEEQLAAFSEQLVKVLANNHLGNDGHLIKKIQAINSDATDSSKDSSLDIFAVDFFIGMARSQNFDYADNFHLRVYDKNKHLLSQEHLKITDQAAHEYRQLTTSIDIVRGFDKGLAMELVEADINFSKAVNNALVDRGAVDLMALAQKDMESLLDDPQMTKLIGHDESFLLGVIDAYENLAVLRFARGTDNIVGTAQFYELASRISSLDDTDIDSLADMLDFITDAFSFSFSYLGRSLDEQGLLDNLAGSIDKYGHRISKQTRAEIDEILGKSVSQ